MRFREGSTSHFSAPHPNGRPDLALATDHRQSQELSSSLATRRESNANGDSYGSGSGFRHTNTGGGRGAEAAVGEEGAAAEGGGEARRAYGSSSGADEEKPPQRRSSTAAASGADAQAGREISDIDRRLGELHEFLKKAKEGGLGALPLPPPPPTTTTTTSTVEPRRSQAAAASAATSPPPTAAAGNEGVRLSGFTAAAESTMLELLEDKPRSPSAAGMGGEVGRVSRRNGGSGSSNNDGGVPNWQGGGAGEGAAGPGM